MELIAWFENELQLDNARKRFGSHDNSTCTRIVYEVSKHKCMNIIQCSDFFKLIFFLIFLPNLFILYKEMNDMFYVLYSVFKIF